MGIANSRFVVAAPVVVSKIAEQLVGGGGQVNFDFQAIPQTFRHLELIWYGQQNAALGPMGMRFNNDQAANYDDEEAQANTAAVAALQDLAGLSMRIGAMAAAGAAGGRIWIPHYANATYEKIAICSTAYNAGNLTGNFWREMNFGHWRSAAAINRITLLNANLRVGSIASLYGHA